MKLHYDEQTDGLYLIFEEAQAQESEEIAPGIILDYDRDNRIVAVEVLNFRGRKDSLTLPLELKWTGYDISGRTDSPA